MRKFNNAIAGLAVVLAAGSSLATNVTYEANYPPTNTTQDINGSLGADTARSFVGAARMAIHANRGVVPPSEDSLLYSCQVNSTTPNHWPEFCNPHGMRTTLNQGNWGGWISSIYEAGNQAEALGQQISALRHYRSPNIVPIYGQGDHWVMVYRMVVDASGNIIGVVFRDGGPGGQMDSSFNSYDDGPRGQSGDTWKTSFYRVLASIGSADPFYGKYALLWDPPPDSPPAEAEVYRSKAPASPLSPGERLTPRLVQQKAIEALRLGGLDVTDAEMWGVLSQAKPALPYEVHGVHPDGSDWNYYLVPFLDNTRMLVGMALLDMETATYQESWVLSQPRRFSGLDRSQARGLAYARAALNQGESLDEGTLTWDPAADRVLSRSPMRPFYEFQIKGPNGEARGAVAVRLDTGSIHRVAPCQVSRRARSLTCEQ